MLQAPIDKTGKAFIYPGNYCDNLDVDVIDCNVLAVSEGERGSLRDTR